VGKCFNCNIHPIRSVDYRWQDGCLGKTLVCGYCFGLNDKWFNKVRMEKLDPKEVANGRDRKDR